ncbi:MAG: hypothetical protein C0478_10875, partial [Planctomyces sp.]|nr:hypothetical protein [Planctomyces sp.]
MAIAELRSPNCVRRGKNVGAWPTNGGAGDLRIARSFYYASMEATKLKKHAFSLEMSPRVARPTCGRVVVRSRDDKKPHPPHAPLLEAP